MPAVSKYKLEGSGRNDRTRETQTEARSSVRRSLIKRLLHEGLEQRAMLANLLHSLIPGPAAQPLAEFGYSAAMDGDLYVVGSPFASTPGGPKSGLVYVFNATSGALVTALADPESAFDDRFGSSVAVAGNLVVVGAPNNDAGATQRGAAYVFHATSGCHGNVDQSYARHGRRVWHVGRDFRPHGRRGGSCRRYGSKRQRTGVRLRCHDRRTGCHACQSRTLRTRLVWQFRSHLWGHRRGGGMFGRRRGQNSGRAYVFHAPTGALVATLANPAAALGDQFGYSVAVDGPMILVGVPRSDTQQTDSGVAYIFAAANGTLLATLTNPTPAESDWFGMSVAIRGKRAVVGAPWDDVGALDAGQAYVFDVETGDLMATLANPTPERRDWFGSSVSAGGNKVIVGAPRDDTAAENSGQAYVFDAKTGVLVETLVAPPPATNDEFGHAVAVAGNTIVVGAPYEDAGAVDSGQAYVYDVTTGVSVATLVNPTPASGDQFGYSVAVSGNSVVVGAWSDDTGAQNSGQAYVFDAKTGKLLITLANPTPDRGDLFGNAVAVSGNTVVVGAAFDRTHGEYSGRAYVFDATTGELMVTLANPTFTAFDLFGWSVGVSGEAVVVGAFRANNFAGQAFVFDARNGALRATLADPAAAAQEEFAYAVAISENMIIVGAPDANSGTGKTLVFDATTGKLVVTSADPTPEPEERFGWSVAISGKTVVVGAFLADTGAIDSGEAYVFHAKTGTLVTTLAHPKRVHTTISVAR